MDNSGDSLAGRAFLVKTTGTGADLHEVTGSASAPTISVTASISFNWTAVLTNTAWANSERIGERTEFYTLNSTDHGFDGDYVVYNEFYAIIQTDIDNADQDNDPSTGMEWIGVTSVPPTLDTWGDYHDEGDDDDYVIINFVQGDIGDTVYQTNVALPPGKYAVRWNDTLNADAGGYEVRAFDTGSWNYAGNSSWSAISGDLNDRIVIEGGAKYVALTSDGGNPAVYTVDGTPTEWTGMDGKTLESLVDPATMKTVSVGMMAQIDAEGNTTGHDLDTISGTLPAAQAEIEFFAPQSPPPENSTPVFDLAAGTFLGATVDAAKYTLQFDEAAGAVTAKLTKVVDNPYSVDVTKFHLTTATPIAAVPDATIDADLGNGNKTYQVFDLAENALATHAAGKYAIYSKSDGIYIKAYTPAVDQTPATLTGSEIKATSFVGNATIPEYAPGPGANAQLFEIEMIQRWGDIIQYGVVMKDDPFTKADESSAKLSTVSIDISWASGDYEFWQDQFEVVASNAPAEGSSDAGSVTDYHYDAGDPANYERDVFSIGMVQQEGMTLGENEVLATFMLKKTNDLTTNSFQLDKSQYSYHDFYATGEEAPEAPSLTTHGFNFADHDLTIDLANERGQHLSNVEMFVTDIGTTDGLSVIPVMKNGNIVKYQVVMNVATPAFIAGVDTNPFHQIQITGSRIFKDSIIWHTNAGMMTTEGADLISSTVAVEGADYADSLELDGVSFTAIDADVATYTGQEFFHTLQAAADYRDSNADWSDLATAGKAVFSLENVVMPTKEGEVPEGRYVIAEFFAYEDVRNPTHSLKFKAGSSNTSLASITLGSERTITRHDDGENLAGTIGTGTDDGPGWFVNDIADGSDIVILGDGFYVNENAAKDAVGAEDALGALRIFQAEQYLAGSSATIFSEAAIIAADFNGSGEVDAADAHDILSYSVHGENANDPLPEWIYIDDIGGIKGLTGANVVYDPVIDEYIFQDGGTLDVMAVLRGDVTSSWTESGTSMSFLDKGIGAIVSTILPSIITTSGTAPDYSVSGAAGFDIVKLGAGTGVHEIDAFDATVSGDGDMIIISPELYALYSVSANIGTGSITYDSGADPVGTAPDAAAITAKIAELLDGGTKKIANFEVTDTNGGLSDEAALAAQEEYWVFDIDGIAGYNAATDLMIHVEGGFAPTLHVDPSTVPISDWWA